jgi:nitrogen fixation-related uncharacterized protein
MFYVWWIGLIAAALWVSIAAFVWAIQSGQFTDQSRARYLPLRDEVLTPPAENEHPSRLPVEVYVLMIVVGIGLLSIAMTLLLILKNPQG